MSRRHANFIMGCEALGGTDWGECSLTDMYDAVNCAWELGVSFFDTADVYGLGRSEERLSEALGTKRHDATIITKFGCRWKEVRSGHRAEIVRDMSPGYMAKALDGSLRRLRLECIPVYLVHWPDLITDVDVIVEGLERACDNGKIQSYGFSNFSYDKYVKFLNNKNLFGVQGPFSLLNCSDVLVPYKQTRGHEKRVMGYGLLAQGLLTGKYNATSSFQANDRRHRLSHFQASSFVHTQSLLDLLHEASLFTSKSMAQIALRWCVEAGVLSDIIVGAKSSRQMMNNFDVYEWELGAELKRKLDLAAGL